VCSLRRKLMVAAALCATVAVASGCPPQAFLPLIIPMYTPVGVCEVESLGEIVVEADGTFLVPDQVAGACNSVEISRQYSDPFERDLLLSAQRAGSTVGTSWNNPSRTVLDLLVPDSIGQEALQYYVQRSRRLEEEFPTRGRRSRLVYTGVVRGPPQEYVADTKTYKDVIVVEMALQFYELDNAIIPRGLGIDAHRVVPFDIGGQIVDILGDGEVHPIAIN